MHDQGRAAFVEDHQHAPGRRGQRDQPARRGDGPGIALHRKGLGLFRRAKARGLPGLPEAKLGHRLGRVALPLHGKGHALAHQRQMPDRVGMQPVLQHHLFQHRAFGRQHRQVRPHGGDVQLGAVLRVGLDAPIRHHQPPVCQPLHVMRADAATVPFADAGIACRLPQPDPPQGPLGHHFRGHQHPAVRGEHAMAVELPPLGRGQPGLHRAGDAVDDQREGAGAAGEGHGLGPGGMGGGGMAAGGQGNGKEAVARRRQPVQFVGLAHLGGGKEIRAARRGPADPRQARRHHSRQKAPPRCHLSPRPPS